jgi:hypothetical protein
MLDYFLKVKGLVKDLGSMGLSFYSKTRTKVVSIKLKVPAALFLTLFLALNLATNVPAKHGASTSQSSGSGVLH